MSPRRSSSSSSSSSEDDENEKKCKKTPKEPSKQNPDKLFKLEINYHRLLESTAKLMQRTTRRHTSIKDLERSVLYLRSLYNQVEKGEVTHVQENESGSSSEIDEGFVEKWAVKRTFMVECDKERRVKKREGKELEKRRRQKEVWERWRQERLQIMENEKQAKDASLDRASAAAV